MCGCGRSWIEVESSFALFGAYFPVLFAIFEKTGATLDSVKSSRSVTMLSATTRQLLESRATHSAFRVLVFYGNDGSCASCFLVRFVESAQKFGKRRIKNGCSGVKCFQIEEFAVLYIQSFWFLFLRGRPPSRPPPSFFVRLHSSVCVTSRHFFLTDARRLRRFRFSSSLLGWVFMSA